MPERRAEGSVFMAIVSPATAPQSSLSEPAKYGVALGGRCRRDSPDALFLGAIRACDVVANQGDSENWSCSSHRMLYFSSASRAEYVSRDDPMIRDSSDQSSCT